MPEGITRTGELVEGRKYQVSWSQQSGNYRWYEKMAVWTFIGWDMNKSVLIWSGRPACGTQDMNIERFISAIEVPKTEPCTLPHTTRQLKAPA